MARIDHRDDTVEPGGSEYRRRGFLKLCGGFVAAAASFSVVDALAAPSGVRSLSFLNLHTGERLQADYWLRGAYQDDVLSEVNRLMRDHRTGDIHPINPRLLDVVSAVRRLLGSQSPVHVISGYRSPRTNAALHSANPSGVAVRSYHTRGMAIDLRFPDRDTRLVRNVGLKLGAGGVGYYPRSNFVHLDVGPVRRW